MRRTGAGRKKVAYPRREIRSNRLIGTLLLLTIALAVALDSYLLFRYPVAAGIDGYYYLIQIKALHVSGHLYFPSKTPVAFWILLGIWKVLGNAVLSLKLLSLFLELILVASATAVVFALTQSLWMAWIGAIVLGWGMLHLFLVSEFLKQLTAYVFLLLALLAMVQRSKSKSFRIIVSASLAGLAVFTHFSAAAWVLAACFFGLILRMIKSQKPWQKIIAFTFLAVAFAAPAILSFLPEAWHVPFQSEFSSVPAWSFTEIGSPERYLAFAVSVWALILIFKGRGTIKTSLCYTMGIIALFTFVVTFNPFLLHPHGSVSLAGRLGDVSYVQLAFLLPSCLFVSMPSQNEPLVWMTFLLLTAVFAFERIDDVPHGLSADYLGERSDMVSDLAIWKNQIAKPTLVGAPHGDDFVATYVLEVPALPSPHRDNDGAHVYWILRALPCQALNEDRILSRREVGCTAFLSDSDALDLFKSVSRKMRVQILAQNRHYYNAFH